MTTQQQTERDEALIAEVARAISRKVDSFGDTERIEQQRAQLEWPRYREHAKAAIDVLRGDEPAKPDRYMTTAYEVWNTYTNEGPGAAAAVLRRHFEPPEEVLWICKNSAANRDADSSSHFGRLRDFILKGDQ